jgi:hypothetical protein
MADTGRAQTTSQIKNFFGSFFIKKELLAASTFLPYLHTPWLCPSSALDCFDLSAPGRRSRAFARIVQGSRDDEPFGEISGAFL